MSVQSEVIFLVYIFMKYKMENSPPPLGTTNNTPAVPSWPRGTQKETSNHWVDGHGWYARSLDAPAGSCHYSLGLRI